MILICDLKKILTYIVTSNLGFVLTCNVDPNLTFSYPHLDLYPYL